ncbi:MAG: SDR family oxidoreductase, partial [Pseudonocardia sp.]|nr:SDR family oxidoreductase [Pseudonocardia sp.]
GLGASFALVLAGAGADLVIGARRVAELAAVRNAVLETGRRCVALAADVTKAGDCSALVAAAEELGGVHVLVNNAGTGYAARAERDDAERAARVVDVNLMGAFRMAAEAGRAMIARGDGGSIVNVSSALGLAPGDVPQAAYAASKAGLLGLTRELAAQWAGHAIRVNALVPGFFSSEMTEPLLSRPAGLAAVVGRTPLGRVGRPAELAGPLLLLASDAGSYMTGASLCVDGGWTMH